MSRVLKRIGARRGKPKPIVARRLSERQQRRRLKKIREVIKGLQEGDVAFYEDEVDIHLNPRIGLDWMAKGQQKTVLTPGQNMKAYIAGALNAVDGNLVWVGAWNKSSSLFIALLERLEHLYPDAANIYVFLDNYSIHHSAQTRRWLADHPRLKCVFLPPYSPDHNRIERLWQDLHANVTRNHRFPTMEALCEAVARWLNSVKWWGQGRSPVYITTPITSADANPKEKRAA
jgi:transposase